MYFYSPPIYKNKTVMQTTTVITDTAHTAANIPVGLAKQGVSTVAPTGAFNRVSSGPFRFFQRATFAVIGNAILTGVVMFLFALTAFVLGVVGFSLLANVYNVGPASSISQFTVNYIALYVFSTIAALIQMILPCLITGLSIHQSTLPWLTGLFIFNLGIFALQLATLIISSEQRFFTFLISGLDGRVYHGLNLMIASSSFSTVTAFLTTILLAANIAHFAGLSIKNAAVATTYEAVPAKTMVVAQQPAYA